MSECNSISLENPFCSVRRHPGAINISRIYALEEQGRLPGGTANGIITNIVSYGFTSAALTCKESFVASQDVTIDCDPIKGEQVRTNPNCIACKQWMQNFIKSREKLEHDAHALNPNYIPQTPSKTLMKKWYGLESSHDDGICKYVCKQCIAIGINQDLSVKIVNECDVSTETFLSAFLSGMSAQSAEEVRKHQNALNSTGANIQNEKDIKSFGFHIADSLRSMTTISTLNELWQNAFTVQNFTIDSGSTSVVVQNANQTMSVSLIATIVSRLYSNTRIKTSVDYETNREIIKLLTSLNDLVKDVESSADTLEELMKNMFGKIMITVVALIAITILIAAAVIVLRKK